MKGREKIVIDKNTALIVIDAQVDFIDPKGKLYVSGIHGEPDNETIIAGIRALNQKPFGYRAATRDDHPEGHVEFSIFGPHCVQLSEGAEFAVPLREMMRYMNARLIKGSNPAVISYSVATAPDFGAHIAQLRKYDIKRILLCGWAYTHCVGESAIAYICQNFEVCLVRDLTRSVPPPYGDPAGMKKKLELYGVKEIKTGTIVDIVA